MEHWYVYYKLPADSLPALLPALRLFVQDASRAAGVAGQLQVRNDVKDGIATVMEVYPQVAEPAKLEAAMQTALLAHPLPPQVRSGRHIERFRDL